MNWLVKLLISDLPDGAALDTTELSVRGLFPLWAAAILWVLATAGVIFLYLQEKARMSLPRRLTLALVRASVLGVLLFLILRPVLTIRYQVEQPRDVVLLVDNSLSMTQRDQRMTLGDRLRVAIAENRVPVDTAVREPLSQEDVPAGTSPNPQRIELIRGVLEHPGLRLAERLEQRGPLQRFAFGQRLKQIGPDLGELHGDEAQTSLADALHELLIRGEARVPAGIVLFTDGRDNASKRSLATMAQECARRGTPLHIYGPGTAETANLQLKDAAIPDRIFFDDTIAVPIRYRVQGFKEGSAELTLTLGGKVVAQRELQLRPGEEQREVLTFTPRKEDHREDKTDLVAAIRYKGQENFLEDNEVRRRVRLSDRKVQILYVENTPRWEYKFLMQTLLRDRRVDASVTLVQGDERALKSGPPYVPGFPATRQDLFQYDLLILGDVPATYFPPDRMEWIRDFVSEGGGLVQIAGRRHAPASYSGTPLAELLPVEPATAQPAAGDADKPFTPILTRAGEQSEMLTFADTPEDNRRAWQELEPWQWHFPVQKLRPGATALLAHPTLQADGQPMPVLAGQPYGKGLVLFLGTDETWRWRYNTRDKFYARFWGQIAYQMGLPHMLGNLKRVQMDLEQSEVTLGRAGHVFIRLLDSDYRPLVLEKLTARLEPAEKGGRVQTVTLQPVENQPGEYRALLAHATPGKFVLKLEQPEPASLEYEVKLPPSHELAVAGMAEEALREAARLSGGAFYREEDLHRLPDTIEAKTVAVAGRQEVLLWNPLMLLVFVGLITAEWLLRKFSNLS